MLLNNLIKKKVSIVSPKIHTTRDVISGILNIGDTQLIFSDTPGIGIVDEKKNYNKKLSRSISTIESIVDCNLFVLNVTRKIEKKNLTRI